MSAAAPRRASRARGLALKLLVASACLCSAAPASAEVGASLSIFSDSRFRGYSLSAGHPVAIADLSYDDPGGLYGAVSGTAVIGSGEAVRPLGLQLNGGYAKRLSSGLTLDLGAVHSSYSRYSSSASATSYTEIYAGVARKFVSARVAFSPHYFERGARTFYGELNGDVSPLHKIHLEAHAGVLLPLHYQDRNENPVVQYDWRAGAAYDLGSFSLHAILTGGGPGKDYYRGERHSRTALIVGISRAL